MASHHRGGAWWVEHGERESARGAAGSSRAARCRVNGFSVRRTRISTSSYRLRAGGIDRRSGLVACRALPPPRSLLPWPSSSRPVASPLVLRVGASPPVSHRWSGVASAAVRIPGKRRGASPGSTPRVLALSSDRRDWRPRRFDGAFRSPSAVPAHQGSAGTSARGRSRVGCALAGRSVAECREVDLPTRLSGQGCPGSRVPLTPRGPRWPAPGPREPDPAEQTASWRRRAMAWRGILALEPHGEPHAQRG